MFARMLLLLQQVRYPFYHIYELPTMFVSNPIRLLKAVKSETVLVLLCTLIWEKVNYKSWFKKVLIVLERSWQFKMNWEGVGRKKKAHILREPSENIPKTTFKSISCKLTLPDTFCKDWKFHLMHIIGSSENQEVILINKADVYLHSSLITYAKPCIWHGTHEQWLISPALLNNTTVCIMWSWYEKLIFYKLEIVFSWSGQITRCLSEFNLAGNQVQAEYVSMSD